MIPSGRRVHLPVTSPTSSAFPKSRQWVGFPDSPRKETSCGRCFEIVAIPYVQASWFVRHPGLPCRCAPTGSQDSRDFYTRATHASSPMRASGMLAVWYRQLTAEGLSPSQTCSHVGRYQSLDSSGSCHPEEACRLPPRQGVAESARGISPRAAHRTVRKSLDLHGSCHRLKTAVFRQDIEFLLFPVSSI